MDEAAARVRFGVPNHTEKLAELRNQITEKELQLEDALSNSDIALAKQCKEEKEALEAELEKQTKKAQREIRRKNLSVTEDDVLRIYREALSKLQLSVPRPVPPPSQAGIFALVQHLFLHICGIL
jgi:ATP-dependent Clp protease ATP-binding subunit ClpA